MYTKIKIPDTGMCKIGRNVGYQTSIVQLVGFDATYTRFRVVFPFVKCFAYGTWLYGLSCNHPTEPPLFKILDSPMSVVDSRSSYMVTEMLKLVFD